MKTLEIAYKILYGLENKERVEYVGQVISPEKLGISQAEWLDVMKSLMDENYIAGVSIKEDIIGNVKVDIKNARITLKGAEYLNENSVMKKIAKVATDVISIIK